MLIFLKYIVGNPIKSPTIYCFTIVEIEPE